MSVETLETAIAAVPGVLDCGVVSERSETDIERATALVVRGQDWNQQKFVEQCERTIPAALLPWKVIAVKSIPRGQDGKIDRQALLRLAGRLSLSPSEAVALTRRGAEFEAQGRFAEALDCYRRLLDAKPENFDLLPRLGRLLLKLGRATAAERVLRDARQLVPNSAELVADHGIALAMLGAADDAIACFRAAIATDPACSIAYYNLGRVCLDQRNFEDAKLALESAVRLKPDFADAHCALGEAIFGLGRPHDAIAQYKCAIELQPRHHVATFNMGVSVQDLNRPDDAIAHFKRAVEIEPSFAVAHRAIGIAYQSLGRPEEGRPYLEKALALEPRNGRFIRDIVDTARSEELAPLLTRIDSLLSEPVEMLPTDRVHLLAAKSTAQERLGQHALAFQSAIKANDLALTTFATKQPDTIAATRIVMEVFSPTLIAAKRASRNDSGSIEDAPIFVVGMPRSGTTLVEHILASHSTVFGSGEVDLLNNSILELGAGSFGTEGFFKAVPSVGARRFVEAGSHYLADTRNLSSLPRIANKHLGNTFRVGLINLMLPGAKIVHVMRNPVDTCVSRYMSVFFPGNSFSYDLRELGAVYREYEHLMEHWRSVLPPETMLDVQYESVIANPEVEIRKLLEHCGLEWEQGCLDFHETRRAVSTPTRNQVRQPAYSSSVGRWRRYSEHLGPLLEGLERDQDGQLVRR